MPREIAFHGVYMPEKAVQVIAGEQSVKAPGQHGREKNIRVMVGM